MHGHGLADDETIADELADGLTGVGVRDLVHLVRVEPNLALAAAHHGGGQALLGAEVDPVKRSNVSSGVWDKWLNEYCSRFPPLFIFLVFSPLPHCASIITDDGSIRKKGGVHGKYKEKKPHPKQYPRSIKCIRDSQVILSLTS